MTAHLPIFSGGETWLNQSAQDVHPHIVGAMRILAGHSYVIQCACPIPGSCCSKIIPLLGAWITWIPHSQWLTFGKGPSTGTCNFGARRNGNVQQLSTIHQSEIIQSYQDFPCKAPLLMSSWVVIFVRMSCPMMSFLWINDSYPFIAIWGLFYYWILLGLPTLIVE